MDLVGKRVTAIDEEIARFTGEGEIVGEWGEDSPIVRVCWDADDGESDEHIEDLRVLP